MSDNEEKPAVSLKEMKKFEKWTKSLKYITGLGMTEEEKIDFKKRLNVDLEITNATNVKYGKTTF
ncbi:unnamed protein product [Mucor hiemalis]